MAGAAGATGGGVAGTTGGVAGTTGGVAGASGGGTAGAAGQAGGGTVGGGTAGTAGGGTAGATGGTAVSVLQHHNDLARDGLYIDPAFTQAAAANLAIDPSFADAMVSGSVYAQPLYLAGVNGGPDEVIAATEDNNVHAFDAATGSQLWTVSVGAPRCWAACPAGSSCRSVSPGHPSSTASTGSSISTP